MDYDAAGDRRFCGQSCKVSVAYGAVILIQEFDCPAEVEKGSRQNEQEGEKAEGERVKVLLRP